MPKQAKIEEKVEELELTPEVQDFLANVDDMSEEEIDAAIENMDEESKEQLAALNEDSEALATMHPNTKPSATPKDWNKLDVMKNVIGHLASMESDELCKWWEETVGLIGNEGNKIPGSAEAHNKNTIAAKPSNAVGHQDGAGTVG